MGGAGHKAKRRQTPRPAVDDRWRSLTWEDLAAWAGERSVMRGRTYHRQGAVDELALSPDGRLLATVQGRRRYVTSVWWGRGKRAEKALQSQCSCPVGLMNCKHAVAVVAAYLQAVADEVDVPEATPDDPRWEAIAAGEEDWDVDDAVEVSALDEHLRRRPLKRRRSEQVWDEKIRSDIAGRSHDELVDLLMSLMDRFPELRQEFRERVMLAEGDVDRLVRETRREIRDITAEPGWRNHWEGGGFIPDYSRLKHRLERLVERGHADAIVKLADELIRRGTEQVELSHDEGETAMALGECLAVVFQGVARSSLPGPQKLLFAIDAHLRDDYGIIGDATDVVLEAEYTSADWSAVADELQQRLKRSAKREEDGFHGRYQRDRMTDWLSMALTNAGRDDELLAIYEREARATDSYDRLVRHLIDAGRYEDAQHWAEEGIERTREKWPGIASSLAERLAEVAEAREQWDQVAAHAAWRFLEQPSHESFKQLIAAAGKARCREKVRKHALRFLETGKSPIRVATGGKAGLRVTTDRDWPLPVSEQLALLMRQEADARPHYHVLLEMALAAKDTDQVLHWYDKLAARNHGTQWSRRGLVAAYADTVAAAVANSHPERALVIYQQQLEANLPEASHTAYQACASYLRKMRPVMKTLRREREWKQRVEQIRQDYRRRPRFMEILDGIEGKAILDSHKTRRRRA